MTLRTIAMIGGTGFVGGHMASELAHRGYDLKILTRNRERHRELMVLPTVQLLNADIHDDDDLDRHLRDVDAVINLAGILNERGRHGKEFWRVHVDLPRRIAEITARRGIERVLHMSALGADAAYGPSFYLRSKAEGEGQYQLHGHRDLAVTIFRPSVIFGPGDSFINRFAGLLKRMPGVFPLACPDSRYAPVYVGDVVTAFADSLGDPETHAQRYPLCGPEVFTLQEIVEYTARAMSLRRKVVPLGDGLSRLQANVMEHFPGKPFSRDNYLSTRVPNVCGGDNATPRFVDPPTPMNAVVPGYLRRHSVRKRYPEYRSMPTERHAKDIGPGDGPEWGR